MVHLIVTAQIESAHNLFTKILSGFGTMKELTVRSLSEADYDGFSLFKSAIRSFRTLT